MSTKQKTKKFSDRDELVRLEMPRWQAEQVQKLLDGLNKTVRDYWGLR